MRHARVSVLFYEMSIYAASVRLGLYVDRLSMVPDIEVLGLQDVRAALEPAGQIRPHHGYEVDADDADRIEPGYAGSPSD